MTQRTIPKLSKWPFLVGDVLLLATAFWIVSRSPDPFALWPLFLVVALVALGAWIAVTPFIIEYRASLRFAEADDLATTVAKINEVQSVADKIGSVTGQLSAAQEQSAQTVAAVRGIADRITAEATAFSEFLSKANEGEKNRLQLEIEKLRRGESEWLQVLVRLLDHVHALYQAGVRSGQPNVYEQLSSFQKACRDVVRRLGLVPIDAEREEPFDDQRHQLLDGQAVEGPVVISDIIATGYTFQGQLLRRAVVAVRPAAERAPSLPVVADEAPAAGEQETDEAGNLAQEDLLSWEDEAPRRE